MSIMEEAEEPTQALYERLPAESTRRSGSVPSYGQPWKSPALVGWAGGGAADKLCRLTDAELVETAITSLSRILNFDQARLNRLLDKAFVHNWSTDPFSRGAYSYVGLNGLDAMKQLATPVKSTLFFAGEATSFDGHWGTVHGAIGSGRRVAREVLDAIGRKSETVL